MRSAPWLVLGGTVAGFLGVLGLHRPAHRPRRAPDMRARPVELRRIDRGQMQ